MEPLIKVQNNYKNLIERAYSNYKKSPKERLTVNYIQTRLEQLEQIWNPFFLNHQKIIQLSDSTLSTNLYTTDDIFIVTEEIYITYKCDLKDALSKVNVTNTMLSSNTNDCSHCHIKGQVKLRNIEIPKFSGNYSEWTTFKDLFTSLVHNNSSLDAVQKMQYLKCYLEGEAAQLIKHITVSADNYESSWAILENRYSNKKHLVNCLLDKLTQLENAKESAQSVKQLLDTMTDCLNGLKTVGCNIESWDAIVIYLVSCKLSTESRLKWESLISTVDELPTLEQFKEFLHGRFRSLEFLDKDKKPKSTVPKRVNVSHVSNSNNASSSSIVKLNCQFCKGNHKIINCKDFVKSNYDTRYNFVRTSRLCFNCFGLHTVSSCRQSTRCRICAGKHHSLLHKKRATQETENVASNDDGVVVAPATISQNDIENVVTCFSDIHSQVLLATAVVGVETRAGNNMVFRCLLDQGSMASLITESAVQALGLKKLPTKIYISGVGGRDESLTSTSMVEIKLKSHHDPSFTLVIKAYVLSKLTSFLPPKRVRVQLWPEISNLKLADPRFNEPSKVDLLLGADVYGQILVKGLIKGPPGCPVAQNTQFGWILSGRIHSESPDSEAHRRNIVSMHTNCREDEQLKKFWELELDDISVYKKMLTDDELKCEEIFNNTVSRDDCGRYIVKLPFRHHNPTCKNGNSLEIATKRLCQLEKRLAKNPELKDQYTEVIQEYLHLNHMELIPEEQREKPDVVYLPHHAVVRKDKLTSRVRVVFDASCAGSNGISLNDDLLIGPQLQHTLRHIIMRWRKYPICLVADIVKMYRQVKVTPEDADEFQRILWRDESGTIQHYRMLRVTFGTASAPYLAVKVLQQVAHDERGQHAAAVERILKDFYMDDLMTGCQTVEECLKLKNEISNILIKGGFELQKWASNSKEFMKRIGKGGEEKKDNLEIGIGKETEAIQKVLGLTWNSNTDEFEYSIQLPPLEVPVTKRRVISDISRLFDPLGWIAPTIVTSKIFIQKLWMSGMDWDHELPPQLLQEWLTYRSNLERIKNFRIPRWIHQNVDDKVVELHGFCDASNDAFAAVLYIRIIDKDNRVHVNLVTSKTKVSPIKQVSIPRLELCGAQLLAKLLVEVSEILEIPKEKIHAWTDSSVVLAWLSSHPSRWKTFVANRVSDVLTVLERNQWSHVRSKDNPADCASRGVNEYNLNLWKHGPSWLSDNIINYSPHIIGQDTKLEEKVMKICHTVDNVELYEKLFTRYSSLRKLIRAVVHLRRYLKWLKSRSTVFPNYLTSQELKEALDKCLLYFQKKFFYSDIESITKSGSVTKKSKFTSLNPYLDNNGLLRVGGRLQNAELCHDTKHPILIPRNSHLAQLIIAEAHERTLHGGPQLMLNYLRLKYWIVDAKNLVKFYVRKCVTCTRYSAPSNQPIMGQLPAARVTASRAFRQTGVDYAGPITIRATKGRGHRSTKGYICLFICMATKAIHLEVVSDLTSEAFLAAFKRLVSRRGHVSDLWSDNATNFVAAEKELKALLTAERSSVATEIIAWLASNGTTWHRIPPYTPNFGGLWEAGIKSTKHHLKRVIGTSTLTFEEMTTLLAQIEACLNSRPLTTLSEDAEGAYPLTPGHFLVGEPLLLVPGANYERSNISSLRRWQLVQKMTQDFWRRWSGEFLSQFLHRYRWKRHSPEPKIGDVALVKEDNLPPARWLYGLIIEMHTGSDGVTRVVSLRCKGTVIKRPISKLCILPIC